MKEEWRDVVGYEGLYRVSNTGKVESLAGWNGHQYVSRKKMLKQHISTTGYWKVDLKKNGVKHSAKVHRLVAYAFIPLVDGKTVINHKDCNPLNNHVENLEWCTQGENVIHAVQNGCRHNLFETDLDSFITEYRKGKSAETLAEEYGVTRSKIYGFMKRHDIPRRTSGEARNKYHVPLDKLLKDLQDGASNKDLAEKYGCTRKLIATRKYQFMKKGEIYNG